MAWKLSDFGTNPTGLAKKLAITVAGFNANNAPFNRQVVVGGDTYTIVDYGNGPEGTAAVTGETGQQVNVDCNQGMGGNAYLLPWASNTMCVCEVQQKHDLFFTYRLNGCGIIISGGRSNPTVVHGNTKSDSIPVTTNVGVMSAAYRGIYVGMAQALEAIGIGDPGNRTVFAPGDNGYIGFAGVWGVKTGGKWDFYANIWGTAGATVMKIWP